MRFYFNHSLTEHLHIFDALRSNGAYVAASCARTNTPQTKHVDAFFVEPEEHDEKTQDTERAYAEWIAQKAASVNADWVIPYKHRISLAGFKNVFEQHGTKLLSAANKETLDFIEDKPRFLTQMRSEGVRTGDFTLFRTREEFEDGIKNLDTSDLCVKPTQGIGGIGYRRLTHDMSYENLFGSNTMIMGYDVLRKMLDTAPLEHSLMLMAYLPSPERSIDVACLDGKTLGIVTRRRQRFSQLIENNTTAQDMAVALVDRLNLSGFVNIQTRLDHTGEQCLLEINTRASGGVGWTLKSDVNLPHLLMRALEGENISSPHTPEESLEMVRQYTFSPQEQTS